MKKKEEPKN